ncbi:MAG: serine/threonine protein kinase [Deltaproteobacteria bacterium]|nr:serine/threonine protein kinase [Deltaproteobacteria bacterium]
MRSRAGGDGDRWLGRLVGGRYRIVSQLGEGGVGRVYAAEQALGSTRRRLALKMLLPEHAANREVVSRFLRECEVASLVEHPNVVRIYDFGEAERGVLYIAMELVPGRSLRAILEEEGALRVPRALEVLAQVCRGVAAAHDRGIVHRDLKPDNLMVVCHPGEPDFVKVLDFGIAKAVAPGGAALTRLGEVLGSPGYMSPEQHLGEEVDARTDVYALGVLAYEALTGVLPFHGTDMIEWAAQHLGAEPMPFDATPAGRKVPEPIRRAILRALAKDRRARQAGPRELLEELLARPEEVAATEAVEQRSTPVTAVASTVFASPSAAAFVAGHARVPYAPSRAMSAEPSWSSPPSPPSRGRRSRRRRWVVRALVVAAALGGVAFAFDGDPQLARDRLETAVEILQVTIRAHTRSIEASSWELDLGG